MPDRLTNEELFLEQWKLASELQRHEDVLTWGKFQHFTTLLTALVGVLGYLWLNVDRTKFFEIGMIVAGLGIILSFAWLITHERGRMYQTHWIDTAKDAEFGIIGERMEINLTLYSRMDFEGKPKTGFLARFSTQKSITWLIGFILILWIALLITCIVARS